ncbi:KRAB-A domain-containing protein 2-like [Frankliniella occidentalis]|nr:KRAB-A domain-containing protein 2-like [Frankliniella occidentalis]
MLSAWMLTYRTKQWSKGLKYVASQKNSALHQGTGRSPYEAVFGTPMKVGISSSLPSALVPYLTTEEELLEFLEGIGREPSTPPRASPTRQGKLVN